jgi:tripeptide aminopeptidase
MDDIFKKQQKGEGIMQYINKKRLIETFKELAIIPSPSSREEVVAQFLQEKLALLGLDVERDSYGNLIAKLDGEGEPIVLCAHMDTVAVGKDSINVLINEDEGIIRSDGLTILGADNKDSISAILEMLSIIKERNFNHRAIELVFTREEESISRGAENFDFSLISGKVCYISDQSDPYGTITLTAPFLYAFNVEIQGKKCHVKNPEKGVNAIRIMAEAISHVEMPIGRIDKLTTVNIGSVVAGLGDVIENQKQTIFELSSMGRNSVPDSARIYGEVRGADENKVLEALNIIENIFNDISHQFGGFAIFKIEKMASGYIHDEHDPLVESVADIFKSQQVDVIYFDAVGGSDANILEKRGLHCVVFSSAHRNNHQVNEYLIIDDLVRLADFYLELVKA